MTNSLASNDVAIVHAGYSKYRNALLRASIELHEMNKTLTRKQRSASKKIGGSSKASLHTKCFAFDREKIFIGSLNLDPRVVHRNTEIGIVIGSADVASEMAGWFGQNNEKVAFRLELMQQANGTERIYWHGLKKGQPVTYKADPHTSFWHRLGIDLMRLFPIESQL